MTKPITTDMLPEAAIDAGARDLYRRAWGPSAHWPPHNKKQHVVFREKATTVLTGAFNAAIESGAAEIDYDDKFNGNVIIIKLRGKP